MVGFAAVQSSGKAASLLPDCARVVRGLPAGMHAWLELLPRGLESPALLRIAPDPTAREALVQQARVRVARIRGYCWIDDETPCIVLSTRYYREGDERDLYLDLLHELTHLRQLSEGHDVWDDRLKYVDRPTEIEGYAVAIEEGRRLGMTDEEVVVHLSNPWMDEGDVQRLVGNVERFLAKGPRP